MLRCVATLVVALCLTPAWAFAQDNAITITVASANVHKSPSMGSPVIGRAVRGDALQITRELGDWVKVEWPADPAGVGYVRVSMGLRGRGVPAAVTSASARGPRPTTQASLESSRRPVAAARSTSAEAAQAPAVARQPRATSYVTRPTHVLGFGGRINGPSFGIGGSARAWSRGLLGLQLEVSRFAVDSPLDTSRMTTTHIAPSVLVTPTDVISDYMWLRPYAGAGLGVYRSTVSSPTLGVSMSDSSLGLQLFGGVEFTAASLPAVGISLDFGYHTFESPFTGFDAGGGSFGISGHWYWK